MGRSRTCRTAKSLPEIGSLMRAAARHSFHLSSSGIPRDPVQLTSKSASPILPLIGAVRRRRRGGGDGDELGDVPEAYQTEARNRRANFRDLNELFYEQRVLFLGRPLDSFLANELISLMLFHSAENDRPIHLYISCSGGEVRLAGTR